MTIVPGYNEKAYQLELEPYDDQHANSEFTEVWDIIEDLLEKAS